MTSSLQPEGSSLAGQASSSGVERLQALERQDKWFLSCGDGIIWAPPFPLTLHRPGFWDEALVYNHPFAPGFTVALVNHEGTEVSLSELNRSWQPHRLTTEWCSPDQLVLREERFAQPGGRLVSRWTTHDAGATPDVVSETRYLVAFSAQPGERVNKIERVDDESGLRWRRILFDRHEFPLEIKATLSVNGEVGSGEPRLAAMRSEGTLSTPAWHHTPFWEHWESGESGGLRDGIELGGITEAGQVYLAVAIPLDNVATVEFSIEFVPRDRAAAGERDTEKGVAHHGSTARGPGDPATPWVDFFDSFPRFNCSDEYLTRYYDYRIYGLRLNRLEGDCGHVRYPAVAEGIGYFHVPITYSAQCHMWETRWSRAPDLARGSLLNFLAGQRENGSLHGRIYTNHQLGTDFYHANWGDAVLAVDSVHDDLSFLERAYEGLCRYARWLDRTRDREVCGMYDVANHFETGQEYMSRYQVVFPHADRMGWQSGLSLKGIDVTVYAYQLKRALQRVARRLGLEMDSDYWASGADLIASSIAECMWDPAAAMFSDVNPTAMQPTRVKAAVCFYPLLTDLLDEHTLHQLVDHLVDPTEFGAPYPVPSSSMDDPLFSPFAEWKGKRHNCPWNGRTWPMINSHIVEGLIRQWHRGRRNVGTVAVDILTRFVHMMFHNGDVDRPNCYEHYNPITGHPSVYRGIDDYQHSWVLDLLIRGVAGLEPMSDGIIVDPLPFELERVSLRGAVVRGRSIDIERTGNTIVATVDGTEHVSEVGTPLEITYE